MFNIWVERAIFEPDVINKYKEMLNKAGMLNNLNRFYLMTSFVFLCAVTINSSV